MAERKRLEIGRGLATNPRIILLDEVMAGLNPKEVEEMVDLVKTISEWGSPFDYRTRDEGGCRPVRSHHGPELREKAL